MNELTKFCQQLKNLTKRIKKLKQNLINSNDVRMKIDLRRSPSPIRMKIDSRRTPSPTSM